MLLPGMDGTGDLFAPFLEYYPGPTVVIPLPIGRDQDHRSLAKAIETQLPNEPFVLLAESFSGGIVPHLLGSNKNIQGIIFVASFLSSPNRFLLHVAKTLPLTALLKFPGIKLFVQPLLFQNKASKTLYRTFVKSVESIPQEILVKRLSSCLTLSTPTKQKFDGPVIYFKAKHDKLINQKKAEEVCQVFSNTKIINLEGPHFLLQTMPESSAKTIRNFTTSIRLSLG